MIEEKMFKSGDRKDLITDSSEELKSSSKPLPENDIFQHTDLSFLMHHILNTQETENIKDTHAQFTNQSDLPSEVKLEEAQSRSSEEPFGEEGFQEFGEDGASSQEFSFLENEFKELLSNYGAEEERISSPGDSGGGGEESVDFFPGGNGREKEALSPAGESEKEPESGEGSCGSVKSRFKKPKFSILKGQNIFQIGLDIGHSSIKYVISKKQKVRGQILAFGILPHLFDPESDFEGIIEYIVSGLNLNTRFSNFRCAFNISGTGLGLKRHSLPKMNTKMMREAVYWTAKKEFGLEEVAANIDVIKLGKFEKKGIEHDDLLIIGCDENLVTSKLEPLLAKKILPFKATPLSVTLWQLYKKSSVFDNEKSVALIDIGATKTTIAFIKQGVLEFSREIPTGGKDITEALTGTIFYDGKPYQLSTDEANCLKMNYGFPSDELEALTSQEVPVTEYSVLMRPVLERMGSEIQRSIDYFRESYDEISIDHVYLLGGTSQLKNLIPFFSEFIEPELEIFPFSDESNHALPEDDYQIFRKRFGELAIAYCLATDYDVRLNLLPPSIKRLEKLRLFRRISVYAVFLAAILIGIASATSFFNVRELESQFRLMQLQFSQLEPLKKKFDNLQKTQVYLHNKKEFYRKELILDNPLPKALKLIANLFPPDMAMTNVTIIKQKDKSKKKGESQKEKQKQDLSEGQVIRIYGVCYHPRPDAGIQIAEYLRNLRRTKYFRSVSVENQNFLEEYQQLKFEVVAKIKD